MKQKYAVFFNKAPIVFLAKVFCRPTFVRQSTDSDLKKLLMKQRLTSMTLGRRCRCAALALALLCLCFTVSGQGFEKSFGGPKQDFGRAVLQTNDHGYAEVGSSQGELGDDNDFDIFVVRTDVDGTLVWSRRYDEGFIEQGEDVIETPDGGFFIIGHRQETVDAPEETYLLKLSRKGDLVFSRSYGEGGIDERGRQIIRIPGGDYLLTGYRKKTDGTGNDILAIRIDDEGQLIWRTLLGGDGNNEGVGTIVTPAGDFIVGANVEDPRRVDFDIALYGLSADGTPTWSRTFGTDTENEQIEDIIRTSDDNLVFVGSTNNFNKALIGKADLNGEQLWYREIDASTFDDELNGVIEEDGGESLVAVGQTTPGAANFDVLMLKVNATDGQPIWQRRLGDEESTDIGESLAPTTDGGYALAAYTSRISGVLGNEMTLFKTDDLGDLQTNYLRGKVYYPADNDCGPFTEGDLGLAGWLIQAESETATFFGSTDSLGNYDLRVDRGEYELSLLRKNDRWNLCEPDPLTVDLTAPYDSNFHDFALQPAIDCPLLEVALSATPAIQCDTQLITISYGNSGSDIATGASVELILDEHLTFLNASPAPASQDGQELVFEVGDLAPGTEGTITLTARVACSDITEGQAVSSQATIFPILNCAPVSDDWDRSSIVVTSRCDRLEGISFTITNVGTGPMTTTNSYVVVEDIILNTRGDFMLEVDESIEVNVNLPEGDVSTYRLIAEQSEGHPGSLFPTAVVEGCQTEGSSAFTTGFVAQFSDNDGDLFLDILTQEVVALDNSVPIQLTAYPRGYQDSIIIPKTDIEYTVFFAMPDNNSFERVVIRDTLPEPLDFNSLEMGASSHPYDFVLYQGGILKITFDSIRIFSGGGTGEADAVTRSGYVSYRLSQKPNNTTGTVIRNRAAVYFDYQSPALAQEVRHVVGCDDLLSENCLLSSDRNLPEATGVAITVSPNPLSDRTTVRITGWDQPNTKFNLSLFDAAGRKVFQQHFNGNQFELIRPAIPAGTYFYEVTGGGYKTGAGRIVIN